MASWVRFRQRGTAGDEGKSGNRACQNSKIKEGKENSPNVSPSNSFGEPDRGKNNAFRKRSVAEENTSGSKWGAWRKSAADSRQTGGGTSSTKGHHQGPLRGGDGQAHNNQELNREKLLWPQMCKKLADLAKELDMLHERLSNRDDELRSLEAIKRETEEKLLRQLEHERKQIIDDLKVRIHSTESEKQNLQKQVKNVNERLSQQERTLNEGYQQKLHEMTVRMARQQESFNHKMKALEASQKALEASHQKTKEVLQTHHENEMERLRAKFLEKLEEQELNSRAKWEQIEHNLQQELLATKEAMESYLQECDTLRDKLSLTERRFEEIKAAYYGIQGEYFQGKKEVEFIKYELNRIHEEQYRERKDWERHVKMEREEATAKIGLVEGRLKAIQVAMSECVSHLLASLPSLAWSCACSNPLEGTHGTCLRCILEAVIQKSKTERFLARSPSSSEAESEDGDDEDESETWEAKEEALREELESVLNRENELRRRLEELEVKLQERDDEVSQLKTKIEEVDEHLHQTRAELEETQVELRKMKDATAQAKLKAEKEFEERDKEREQRIQELEKRNEELEEEVEELTAQKQDLTKRRDNANSEKEKELKFIHQALEEALTEREELQARFEKEFEFLRTVSSDREQQMLDDFEFKLREIERDYKMRMDEKEKEAECRVSNARQAIEMEMMHDREKILEEKKQAAEQMMKVLHLQSYEPEVRQLQGLVHEQQKALRVANMSCEQLKYTERNLSSEINRLRRQHAEVIARMEQEKDRQLKNELDRLKTKLNNEWEFRLKTECSRLKSELDQLHEEEKELALESQRLQSQQELQELRAEFERRESELLARVHSQSKNS